jgi:hypothetical protein
LDDYLRDRREGFERLDSLLRDLQAPGPVHDEQAQHTDKEQGSW